MTDSEKLAKVRKQVTDLLRKAESTSFGPEAEAAIEKAHYLMAKYSIDELMLHEASGTHEAVIDHTVKVSSAGSLKEQRHYLLNIVARNNRCRAVISGDYMHIIGYKVDCEWVDELYKSLVVQMFEAMYEADDGSKQFQPSFCDGFVTVIDDRLRVLNLRIEADMEVDNGPGVGLVLVKAQEQVDTKMKELFPNLRNARIRVPPKNFDGIGKGKTAGANANLERKSMGKGNVGELNG